MADRRARRNAIDYHTKENREKRKAMQEGRNALSKTMEFLQRGMTEAQQAMAQLYSNVEQKLAMAKYAEAWEWKEVGTTIPLPKDERLLKGKRT
jgi:hypothetical protein